MVNFSPTLGFVPSPVFAPAPVPIAPPVGVPGIGPSAIPVLPQIEPPTNPFVPVPFVPSGIPDLPLPDNISTPARPFVPGSVPDLPLPADAFAPGPETVSEEPFPFSGGGTPGIRYEITVRFIARNTNQPREISGAWSIPSNVVGPVGGVRVANSQGAAPNGNSVQALGVNRLTGQPQWQSIAGISSSFPGGIVQEPLEVVDIRRLDGIPGNGGDNPPVRERERSPNPARNFQPNRIRPFRRPRPRPDVLPEVNPAPQRPPLPTPPPVPDPDPRRRPDRRVPGDPTPISPVTPPEVVPFSPGTIPDLPTFPNIVPVRVPTPPPVPQLPPITVPTPPGDPTRPPQFPPLPPEAPTRQTPPIIVVPPPLIRIPPPFDNSCCAVPEVIRQGESIRRLLRELRDAPPDDCVDLCEPAVMLDIVCEGGLGLPVQTREQAVTVLTLSSALGRLSRQVFEIAQYLNICDTFPDDGMGGPDSCGPGEVGPVIYAGTPPQDGVDVAFGAPPDGRAWVGAITRFVPSAGVGAIPSSVAPNAAYTQVVGNVSLRYGEARGEARQVRSEWNEVIRPVGAPYATGVYVAGLPQCFITIFPVSVSIE